MSNDVVVRLSRTERPIDQPLRRLLSTAKSGTKLIYTRRGLIEQYHVELLEVIQDAIIVQAHSRANPIIVRMDAIDTIEFTGPALRAIG